MYSFLSRASKIASLACLSLLSLTGIARADILVTYSTSLSLLTSTDTSGLHGAQFAIRFSIPNGATYTEPGIFTGYMLSNAQITISGASIVANNVSISMGFLAAFPSRGSIEYIDGGNAQLYLPASPGMYIPLAWTPTESGSTANIGDLVAASHFGPAIGTTTVWTDYSGGQYALVGPAITAINTNAVGAPEPGTLALLGGGLGMVWFGTHRRKR